MSAHEANSPTAALMAELSKAHALNRELADALVMLLPLAEEASIQRRQDAGEIDRDGFSESAVTASDMVDDAKRACVMARAVLLKAGRR